MAGGGEVELRTGELTVRCRPEHGFTITALVDGPSGADALWHRPGHGLAEPSVDPGIAGPPSNESFLDGFVGGCFEMFPSVGFAGTVDGRPTFHHGEVTRLPWQVTSTGATHVEARVRTARTPFEAVRRLAVEGGSLLVSATVTNVGAAAASYAWGFHPCFDRTVFAGGRIDADVTAATVPAPPVDPTAAILAAGPFRWPLAPSPDGSPVDLADIPARADGRSDHACLTPAAGRVRLTAPGIGRALVLEFDVAALPFVLLWENFAARGAPFDGRVDTFALEPSTNPGRTMDDAAGAGELRSLAPGATASTWLRLTWERLDSAPDDERRRA